MLRIVTMRANIPCPDASYTRADNRGDRLAGLRRPTRCLGCPPPVDPAKQLLSRPYRCAISQLRSGYCSRLMSYRHSVSWADNPTCPDCHATNHTVAHLFIAVLHNPRIWPRRICGWHPSRWPNSQRAFRSSPALLTFIFVVGPLPLRRDHSISHLFLPLFFHLFIIFHLIHDPGSPPCAIQLQQRC